MSFLPRTVSKGTKIQIPIQILENSVAKDITGFTFKYGVVDELGDSILLIGPITGTIVSASSGLVTFVIPGASADISTFRGREEMIMVDSNNSVTNLTPPGGVEFNLTWSILGV